MIDQCWLAQHYDLSDLMAPRSAGVIPGTGSSDAPNNQAFYLCPVPKMWWVIFQKAYISLLQMARPCFRTPEVCIAILPQRPAIHFMLHLFPQQILLTPEGLLDCMTYMARLLVPWHELTAELFPIWGPPQSWWPSVSPHIRAQAVFLDVECAVSRSQSGLPGTVLPSLQWGVLDAKHFSLTL